MTTDPAPPDERDIAQLALPELFSSVVVRGYANAMFRLGFRYEVRHNDDEAIRCYGKASRLGNEPAKARLLDIPVATVFKPDEEAEGEDLPGTRNSEPDESLFA